MKYAITFRKHTGPIQDSLLKFAKENSVDVLITHPKDMNTAPNGYSWDDYETIIWFDNKPPVLKTKANLIWWMCDLRHPEVMKKNTPRITARYIAISNSQFLEEYAEAYNAVTSYVPPCGNDTPITEGRKIDCDVLFIGNTGRPGAGPLLPEAEETLAQVLSRNFHWNRLPVTQRLSDAGLRVKVINREGATVDSKWLYQQAPISLSISLPVSGYSSNRLYNILASGGFCLALWFPGIEKLFENHKHLVWFKSYDEAVELAQYYLSNPEKRYKIREAGQERYFEKHSAKSRVTSLLKMLKKQ